MTAVQDPTTTEAPFDERLGQFIGRFVGDLGAAVHAPLVILGDRLGLYDRLADGPATSHELAEQTGTRPSATSREWLRSQAARATSTTTRPRTVLASRRAGPPPRRRGQPRLHGRRLLRRARRWHATDTHRARRSAPARESAGTSTTTACSAAPSASSAPATTRNLVERVDPGARRRQREARARRDGRRRRLRPRRLDDHHGQGVPELDVRRLRLPRGVDRARRASAAERSRRRPTASRFEVAPAKDFPGSGYDLVAVLRLPARHGRPGRRGRPRARSRSPTTAPG